MWMLVVFLVHPWGNLTPIKSMMETPDWAQCNYMHQLALQAQKQIPGSDDMFLTCVWVDEVEQAQEVK